MKTIKATMPCQANQNSWAVQMSANISNDDKVVKDFIRHPLFKEERCYLSSSLEELIAVAKKYKRYGNFNNDVFSFIYEGEDIRHYCR